MSPSSHIGHYRIVSKLGEGGMGAVYRATDTKLNREVAIKVLPAGFADDAARMARFEREAQVLASLNHPNIAAIYGVERGAIVMELVEGAELKSPLPVETAVEYARQIAAGLEAAHEKGIIHRDLKPANIKVTPDGVVKLLDFGLAKAVEESPSATGANPTISPTLSIEATRAGMILGTAAYMAPEQARGAAVDKRADVWAFGVVLLEMLTGVMPFRGETVSDTLAGVLRAPIDWKSLPEDTPPVVRRLLERCLERDPKKRLRDIGEARIVLSDPDALTASLPEPAADSPWRRPAIWAALAIAAVAPAAGVWMLARGARPTPAAVTRFSISLPAGQVLAGSGPAISRDGRFIAYTARSADSVPRLYVRALDRFDAVEIPGSEGAVQPFFSPDAGRVGFFAAGKLLVVSRSGGAPSPIADASYAPLGATWGEDDAIYYTPGLNTGIFQVSAAGGKPQKLTTPDEGANGYAHAWPQYVFETRAVLFSMWGKPGGNGSMLLAPRTGAVTRVATVRFSSRYAESGHLLASGVHGVTAAAFDPAKPREVRPTTSVLEDVFSSANLATSWFAVSGNGTLVYVAGDPASTTLAWVDRAGKTSPIGERRSQSDPSLSPDGARVAVTEDQSIWVHDLRRGTHTRLTFDNEGSNVVPIWSRDGSKIIFGSNRDGDWEVYAVPAGGGPAKRLLARKGTQFPTSEAPDGGILFAERSLESPTSELLMFSPGGAVTPAVVSPANKITGEYSPDGRLLAYVSDETGRSEVYVRALANAAETVAVSADGGLEPRWSTDGRELFFRRGDAFFAITVTTSPKLSVGDARKLFDISAAFGRYSNHAGYSVAPDGRFLVLRPDPRAIPTQIDVVLNWFEELNGKVPARP